MDIATQGKTTTVSVDGRTFKITYSQRYRRLQVRENGRLLTEAHSFQSALDTIDNLAKTTV